MNPAPLFFKRITDMPDHAQPYAKTYQQLRDEWEPIKKRLRAKNAHHPTEIRFHRACSWLQRNEEINPGDDLDIAFTCQWISFNAQYCQWDTEAKDSLPDRDTWMKYLDRILEFDRKKVIEKILIENKQLVFAVLDDAYLSKYFWGDPSKTKALQKTNARLSAPTWYQQGQYSLILLQVMSRIYFMRCQIFHGTSTCKSRLNRNSLRNCSRMLGHLTIAFLQVWINDGEEVDWGTMPYPPVQ